MSVPCPKSDTNLSFRADDGNWHSPRLHSPQTRFPSSDPESTLDLLDPLELQGWFIRRIGRASFLASKKVSGRQTKAERFFESFVSIPLELQGWLMRRIGRASLLASKKVSERRVCQSLKLGKVPFSPSSRTANHLGHPKNPQILVRQGRRIFIRACVVTEAASWTQLGPWRTLA